MLADCLQEQKWLQMAKRVVIQNKLWYKKTSLLAFQPHVVCQENKG